MDDDDAVRALVARTLTRGGYTVFDARTGTEALELAKKESLRIDLLVTDIVMPDMSGPALAQALVGLERLNRVLYMSGYADQPLLREQIERGAVQFLPKPFAPNELSERVRQTLDAGSPPAGRPEDGS